jgi:CheY-like chemotaxis protein
VCRRIRRTDQVPIILLTARSDDIDVVALTGQREFDRHPDGGVVFDEQKARHLPIFTDEKHVGGSRSGNSQSWTGRDHAP